jgi:hypothetical protein
MKQQNVAGLECYQPAVLEQFLVLGQVVAEKRLPIESRGVQRHRVAAGHNFQGAVFCGFRTQCQPGADQFGSLERPVAEVLVPGSSAGEPGLLGHHAVVMGQWQHEVGTEQLCQAGQQLRVGGPTGEQGVSIAGLSQSSDGRPAVRLSTRGGPLVAQVRLVLDRTPRIAEFSLDHLEQPVARLWRGESIDDEESVASEGVLFFEREDAVGWGHGFRTEGGPGYVSGSRHEVLAVSTMNW